MKKLLVLIVALALTLSLTACGSNDEVVALPETVDMTTIDMYLGRENAQYVDLRNFDDKLSAGYIDGFSFIPYFDYLSAEGILTGMADFTIGNEARLTELFDKDAEAIFLMCQSGGRAGWVKAALESLDYTNVFNITGFSNYEGTNLVAGDGSYVLENAVYGMYTPGVYVANAVDDGYSYSNYVVVVTISANGGIENVYIDGITDAGTSKRVLGDDYGMLAYSDPSSIAEWDTQAMTLEAAIEAAQGWDAAWATDGVAGVSVTTSFIKTAFEAALVMATPAS